MLHVNSCTFFVHPPTIWFGITLYTAAVSAGYTYTVVGGYLRRDPGDILSQVLAIYSARHLSRAGHYVP